MTMRVTGVHHVGLHSPDPDRLIAFYRDMFDLVPQPMPPGSIRGRAWFDVAGGTILEVIPAEQPGRDHLAFAVADRQDLAGFRDRLLEAGHDAGEVRDLGFACCLDFHDTDGRRGELVWCAPDQPSDRS